MKKLKSTLSLMFLLIVVSCNKIHTPRIETFQRMDTYWDQKLLDDMKRESSTINNIDFTFNVAHTTEEQIDQIKSAVRRGTEAIIINTTDNESIIPVIEEAYDAGTFVVFVGQKIPTHKYHAYSGIDNVAIGNNSAKYINRLLDGKGNIIIVTSYSNAPYYHDRFESFKHVIEHCPGIKIVGNVDAQWDNMQAHSLMDSLKIKLKDTRVDLVYSFGSMVMGAIESETYPNAIFVGSDGVPGECLTAVKDGRLRATFFNPTGGREAIDAAICMIKGLPYDKEHIIQPTLVTSENAEIIERSIESITNYEQKIDILRNEVSDQRGTLELLQSFLTMLVISLLLLMTAGTLIYIISIKRKKKLDAVQHKVEQLERIYNDVSIQKEIAERMKSELEVEREALINAGFSISTDEPVDVISEAVFMKKFRDTVEKHIHESNYSIDELAAELGVSRAQLFRKIKSESGSTPNDLIQSIRLEKARQMILNGDKNISEISDAVGFSSPSYFSKCYKDKFGTTPSNSADKM